MSKSKQAAKSALIIIIFTLGSKVLGFIREMLIAARFGSGVETDTFFIALTAVGLFTSVTTHSINIAMIPVLSEVETIEGKTGKKDHINNLLNIMFIVSFAVVLFAWILTPVTIKILASGFKGEQYKLAVIMMRIGLLAIVFASVQGIFRGYLQSEMRFAESAAVLLPFNLVYIFFLVSLSSIFGIKGLMVTSVLAVAAQILVQIPGIKRIDYKYNFVLNFRDKYIRKIFYLIPPILVSVAVSDLNMIIDKSLASTLADGSISALNYAGRINGLATGIFVSAITTVIFPMLSGEANKDNYDDLKRTVIYGVNIILLIIIPITVGTIILANPIVRVAFQRGAFDSTATYMTVGALIFYTIGLVGVAPESLLTMVYYSLQDTKTPMYNSFIAVAINIALNFALIRFMAHRGLALATSVSAIVVSLLLLYGLKKKIGSFGFMRSIRCGMKSLVAAMIMGTIVYFLNDVLVKNVDVGTTSDFIALLISVGVGMPIYFILIYLFRIEEVDWVVEIIRNRFNRNVKSVREV